MQNTDFRAAAAAVTRRCSAVPGTSSMTAPAPDAFTSSNCDPPVSQFDDVKAFYAVPDLHRTPSALPQLPIGQASSPMSLPNDHERGRFDSAASLAHPTEGMGLETTQTPVDTCRMEAAVGDTLDSAAARVPPTDGAASSDTECDAIGSLSGLSDFFVPRPEFCRRVLWIFPAESGQLYLYYPEDIPGEHYQRKTLRYSLCFAFRVDSGLMTVGEKLMRQLVLPYSVVLANVAESLREAEMKYGYVSHGLSGSGNSSQVHSMVHPGLGTSETGYTVAGKSACDERYLYRAGSPHTDSNLFSGASPIASNNTMESELGAATHLTSTLEFIPGASATIQPSYASGTDDGVVGAGKNIPSRGSTSGFVLPSTGSAQRGVPGSREKDGGSVAFSPNSTDGEGRRVGGIVCPEQSAPWAGYPVDDVSAGRAIGGKKGTVAAGSRNTAMKASASDGFPTISSTGCFPSLNCFVTPATEQRWTPLEDFIGYLYRCLRDSDPPPTRSVHHGLHMAPMCSPCVAGEAGHACVTRPSTLSPVAFESPTVSEQLTPMGPMSSSQAVCTSMNDATVLHLSDRIHLHVRRMTPGVLLRTVRLGDIPVPIVAYSAEVFEWVDLAVAEVFLLVDGKRTVADIIFSLAFGTTATLHEVYTTCLQETSTKCVSHGVDSATGRSGNSPPQGTSAATTGIWCSSPDSSGKSGGLWYSKSLPSGGAVASSVPLRTHTSKGTLQFVHAARYGVNATASNAGDTTNATVTFGDASFYVTGLRKRSHSSTTVVGKGTTTPQPLLTEQLSASGHQSVQLSLPPSWDAMSRLVAEALLHLEHCHAVKLLRLSSPNPIYRVTPEFFKLLQDADHPARQVIGACMLRTAQEVARAEKKARRSSAAMTACGSIGSVGNSVNAHAKDAGHQPPTQSTATVARQPDPTVTAATEDTVRGAAQSPASGLNKSLSCGVIPSAHVDVPTCLNAGYSRSLPHLTAAQRVAPPIDARKGNSVPLSSTRAFTYSVSLCGGSSRCAEDRVFSRSAPLQHSVIVNATGACTLSLSPSLFPKQSPSEDTVKHMGGNLVPTTHPLDGPVTVSAFTGLDATAGPTFPSCGSLPSSSRSSSVCSERSELVGPSVTTIVQAARIPPHATQVTGECSYSKVSSHNYKDDCLQRSICATPQVPCAPVDATAANCGPLSDIQWTVCSHSAKNSVSRKNSVTAPAAARTSGIATSDDGGHTAETLDRRYLQERAGGACGGSSETKTATSPLQVGYGDVHPTECSPEGQGATSESPVSATCRCTHSFSEREIRTASSLALCALSKLANSTVAAMQSEMRRMPIGADAFCAWADPCCSALVEIALLNSWVESIEDSEA